MTPGPKPVVTIVHSLPGRVRARLSHAPEDAGRMTAAILEHAGLESVSYTAAIRSVLVRYDPRAVAEEEIVLRIALQLSMDHGAAPVRLLAEPERDALAASGVVSAFALAAALAARWLQGPTRRPARLDWIAGIGTAAAVAHHAWRELREQGYFDPEVLSLGYLLSAFARGNILKASTVTWLTSFGRHLINPPGTGVEVRPLEVRDGEGREPRYELVVGPDGDAPERVRALNALRGLIQYAVTGGGAHNYRSLMEELRDVSKVHGEVLEGFGRMRQGIPMRFH